MRLGIVPFCLCAVLCWAAASPVQAQAPRGGGPGKWWSSDKFKQELELTDEQSARIEKVYQAFVPQLRSSMEEIDREQARLSRLMAEANADEAEVVLAIDRVETARYTMSKARTMMLFRINRILAPEQRMKLEKIHQRTGAGGKTDRPR